MGLFDILSSAIEPVSRLVDSLHTSEEERARIKRELYKIEAEITRKALEVEREISKARADVIRAEANGDSWLQRNWRPGLMTLFGALITGHYLGLLAFPIADQAWTLLEIGVGGYIAGRSIEKYAVIKERSSKR